MEVTSIKGGQASDVRIDDRVAAPVEPFPAIIDVSENPSRWGGGASLPRAAPSFQGTECSLRDRQEIPRQDLWDGLGGNRCIPEEDQLSREIGAEVFRLSEKGGLFRFACSRNRANSRDMISEGPQ